MVKVVGLLLTKILPPCCSTILLQMTNPNPVPVFFVVNIGSKILSKYSSGIPGPESLTRIVTNSESEEMERLH